MDGMEAIPVTERIRQSLQDVQRRLSAMDSSARLLVGAIVIILVMGLFLVSQYAVSPAMATIKVESDKVLLAMQSIRTEGYAVEDAGSGMLRVPAVKKRAILALLEQDGYTEAPAGQEPLSTESGGWSSAAEIAIQQRAFRIRTAENSIRMMAGVENVRISLSGGAGRLLAIRGVQKPTATVSVGMKSGPVGSELAESFAIVAVSAETGLDIENVTVIDTGTGVNHRFDEAGSGGGRDYLSSVKSWERKLTAEFARLVRVSFPRAEVVVNAQCLVAEVAQVESNPGKPVKTDTFVETDETSTPLAAGRGGQPGFNSNSGVGSASVNAVRGGDRATRESERVVSDAKFPLTERRTDEIANYPVKVAASLVIPTQEVEALLRAELGEEAEIGLEQINARILIIKSDIRKILVPLVDSSEFRNGTTGEVEIAVMPFASWTPPVAFSDGGGLADSIGELTGTDLASSIKNAGLVGLALFSLAMMFMMVRRTGGTEVMPTAEELAGVPPVLDDDDVNLVGEAEEAVPAMEGLELDDEDLRRKQMLDQLNQLIKKEPSEVASLLRRWMRTES